MDWPIFFLVLGFGIALWVWVWLVNILSSWLESRTDITAIAVGAPVMIGVVLPIAAFLGLVAGAAQ